MESNQVDRHRQETIQRIETQGADSKLKNAANSFNLLSNESRYSYNFQWMGRPIIQYPQDMVAMQEIIWDIKPDLIIETGVAHGGSLVFYASLLELIGNDGVVVGIDIDIRSHNLNEIENHPMSKHIQLISGSSIDKDIVERVGRIAFGKERVLVCLDSNHSHNHVLAELNLYNQFVTAGSYLVVFDTIVEYLPLGFVKNRPWDKGSNPATAITQFLASNRNFQVDEAVDNKLLISSNPGGYLKKVR